MCSLHKSLSKRVFNYIGKDTFILGTMYFIYSLYICLQYLSLIHAFKSENRDASNKLAKGGRAKPPTKEVVLAPYISFPPKSSAKWGILGQVFHLKCIKNRINREAFTLPCVPESHSIR